MIADGSIFPFKNANKILTQKINQILCDYITLHRTWKNSYFFSAFNYFIFCCVIVFLLCGCALYAIWASYSYNLVFLFSLYFVVVANSLWVLSLSPTTTFSAFVSIKFFLLVFSLFYCLPLCLFIIALFLRFISIWEFLRIYC